MENSGDWNMTYHFYWDGWSKIEERNSSDQVLKQYVQGTQYIDELIQTALNDDPADESEDVCETNYWGLQDANFNLLAVIGSDGSFAERYEYTPYGQRTVYKESSAGDDPLLTAPILESQRWKVSSVDQAYGICDVGHQGLFFDKEWGAYDNRHRILGPTVARFFQRDPKGYVDGMSLFQSLASNPLSFIDPEGLQGVKLQGCNAILKLTIDIKGKGKASQDFGIKRPTHKEKGFFGQKDVPTKPEHEYPPDKVKLTIGEGEIKVEFPDDTVTYQYSLEIGIEDWDKDCHRLKGTVSLAAGAVLTYDVIFVGKGRGTINNPITTDFEVGTTDAKKEFCQSDWSGKNSARGSIPAVGSAEVTGDFTVKVTGYK